MAGEIIHVCRYAKHPTVAITGVTHAAIIPGAVSRIDQGAAGTTGRAGTLLTDRSVDVEVSGREIAYALTSIQHGAITLAKPAYARLVPSTVFRTDQGAAGSPGPAGAVVTHYELAVEVFSFQYAELLALMSAAAATLTLGISGAAGAAQTVAVAAVYFDEVIGQVELSAKDAGGKLTAFGIRGHVNFTGVQVFGDVITATPTIFTAMLAKIGAAAANLVLGTTGAAGAAEKHTVKNVYFHTPVGNLELPAKDVGGRLADSFGLRGIALWGGADTYALMITAAADV